MKNILVNISPEILMVIGANLLLLFILFIFNIVSLMKITKMKHKYNRFMSGLSDRNIEELIENCISKVNDVSIKNKEIENHVNFIERNLMQCIQKVGIVRYNAFENVGSDLSFSIALLDSNDNGLILSGIYSRESSSTYSKPITVGKSKYTLSAEEIQALDNAKKIYRERLYVENT